MRDLTFCTYRCKPILNKSTKVKASYVYLPKLKVLLRMSTVIINSPFRVMSWLSYCRTFAFLGTGVKLTRKALLAFHITVQSCEYHIHI